MKIEANDIATEKYDNDPTQSMYQLKAITF